MSSEPLAGPVTGIQAQTPPAAPADVYVQLLRNNLPASLQPLVPFFGRPQRLSVLSTLLDRHFIATADAPREVLDVGCGPLATEYFLPQLHGHAVLAFDYTPAFGAVHAALQRRGHLRQVQFVVGDANSHDFGSRRFDLVLMHDLLYEPALSFPHLLAKFDRHLVPGGLLYLTVQDRRTRWIWAALRREKAHVRYDVGAVQEQLRAAGYRLLDTLPASLDTGRGASRLFQRGLCGCSVWPTKWRSWRANRRPNDGHGRARQAA